MKYRTHLPEFAAVRLHQAKRIALLAHGDQLYGDQPYITHLEGVMKILREQETDPNSHEAVQRSIIAILHDTIEDTDLTKKHLTVLFGTHVARQVDHVSDKPGKNRKARKAAINKVLKSLGSEDYDALLVKAADRLSNVRASKGNAKSKSLLGMYRKEQAAFNEAVSRHDFSRLKAMLDEIDELLLE